MADTSKQDQQISAIDKAIAAANARKNAKSGKPSDGTATTGSTPTAPARPRLTEAEKAAKLAEREAERASRKEKKATERAQKLADRAANRQPAHMRKVQKAAEKLSGLGQAALLLFNEATTNLAAAELGNLARHIDHFNRVKATERALEQKIEADMQVTIVAGDPRFIGKTGTVVKAQRIRCYVKVEGIAKDVYLFTSDVALLGAKASEDAEETPAAANG